MTEREKALAKIAKIEADAQTAGDEGLLALARETRAEIERTTVPDSELPVPFWPVHKS
jgi:hypothetical protein